MGLDLDTEQASWLARQYREMYRRLELYALSVLKERGLAEEAVQETFRIACEKPDRFMNSENPQGWLVKTLQNVMRNTLKTRAHLNAVMASSAETWEARACFVSKDVDTDILYSDLLGEEDYRLLKRIVFDGYSMLEAAQELGITLEACKKRVQRAKKKMKKILEDEEK